MFLSKIRRAGASVLAAILGAVIITTAVPANVQASTITGAYSSYLREEQYNTTFVYLPEEFDAAYYAEKNPDIAASLGITRTGAALTTADKAALYNHYSTTGADEHRPARMDRASIATADNFDAAAYAAHNPDLAAAYGNDAAKLLAHYQNVGCAEGRQGFFTNEKAQAKDKIFSVARSITNDSMTDRQKASAVEHWLVDNVQYDRSNYYNGTIPERDFAIEGPMLYGLSVCEGYSMAFSYFMKVLNIPCRIVVGSNHAWNKVKLGDTWYYVDVTWADGYYTNGKSFYNSRYDFTTDGSFGGDGRHNAIAEYGYHDMGLVTWS